MNKKIFKKYASFIYFCYKFNKYARKCGYNRILDAGISGIEFKLYIWFQTELGHMKLFESFYIDLDQSDTDLIEDLEKLLDIYNREAKKLLKFSGQCPGRSFEWSLKDFARSLDS